MNASAMAGEDYDGIQCTFCHRLNDPFYKTTYDGRREGSDWKVYWDELNSSQIDPKLTSKERALRTYLADSLISPTIRLFSGAPFYVNENPYSSLYPEAGGGQEAHRKGCYDAESGEGVCGLAAAWAR